MKKIQLIFIFCAIAFFACGNKTTTTTQESETQDMYIPQSGKIIPADTFDTKNGQKLYVTLIGHGSVMLEYKGKLIHVDPFSNVADYTKLPKADLIVLTHEHQDHLDRIALDAIKKEDTHYIVSQVCADSLGLGEVLRNGDKTFCDSISFEALPAYNIVNKRPDGEPYHPKGRGNAYLISFDGLTVYIGADTENIPEMDSLKGKVDIAFLPKNLPYTMTDEMFVDAAKKIEPKILYQYHFAEFDEVKISKALENPNMKISVRPMANK